MLVFISWRFRYTLNTLIYVFDLLRNLSVADSKEIEDVDESAAVAKAAVRCYVCTHKLRVPCTAAAVVVVVVEKDETPQQVRVQNRQYFYVCVQTCMACMNACTGPLLSFGIRFLFRCHVMSWRGLVPCAALFGAFASTAGRGGRDGRCWKTQRTARVKWGRRCRARSAGGGAFHSGGFARNCCSSVKGEVFAQRCV